MASADYKEVEEREDKRRQLSELVHVDDPGAVFAEIKRIAEDMDPRFDFSLVGQTFLDVIRLFQGDLPGYRTCNTRYHDLRHTMLVLLAMARLMDGALLAHRQISEKGINIGLVSALMHDTGYIQTDDDTVGSGAKYTLVHIPRSIEFVRHYFAGNAYFNRDMTIFRDILNCTGVNTKIADIQFATPEIELIGKMLGTADLLGQMADRRYLEKLLYLFREFAEAGVKGFETEFDLLHNTLGFYDMTRQRFTVELSNVNRYMIRYFQTRLNIDSDLYAQSIETNMKYLSYLMSYHEQDYPQYLRRHGLTTQARN
jgi:hypothetical protein